MSDDLISRQAAIDGILHLMPPNPNMDDGSAEQLNFSAWKCALTCAEASIKMMPSAQPKSSESKRDLSDMISRQDAIAFVDCGYLRPPTELAWSDKDVVDMLKRLPSAQPEIDKAIRDAYKHGKSKGIKRGMAIAKRKHEE